MISDARRQQLLGSTALPEGMMGEYPPARAAQNEERQAEPAREPMSDQEFQEVVRQLVTNARSLRDEWIDLELDRAWKYYNGEVDQAPMGEIGRDPDTDEKVYEGSRVVLTECRDQVQMMLPDVYRVLAGSEEAIAFQPEGPEDTPYVEQVNDYIRHLFWDRNDGENLTKDALLEWSVKFCAIRVWRENSYKEHVSEHEDLDETALQVLAETDGVEILEAEPTQRTIPVPQVQPGGGTVYVEQPITLYRVRCRYVEPYGRTRIALVPQDEVLVDLEAQSIEEATVIGVDCERRAGELLAMGLDSELIKRMAGKGLRRAGETEDIPRRRSASTITFRRTHRDVKDESLRWVRVADIRVLVDRDKDGIPEPWRVIALGDPLEVAYAVEDPGSDTLVIGSPFPRPHTLIGQGIVEFTMDLQEIGTSIVRRTLDNFARSINPRPAISGAHETTWDDIQSWFGGPIDLGPNGKIEWFNVPFKGDTAIPLLQFFADRRTLRTGISPASQGLDPRALKGQTIEATMSILAGPQSREEGLAREFANRVMRPLFKALLQITQKFQDRAEVIRLRNKFVEVDPRAWNPNMDVSVEVGLGTGSRLERLMASVQVIQQQEKLFAAKSPLFDVKKYRQALADLTHALGVKDDTRYFPDLEDQEYQQRVQQAEQERQQQLMEAAQMEGLVEQAKQQARAQAEMAIDANETKLEHAAKQQQQQLEGAIEQRLLQMEQAWKARLLQLEGVIEERLLKLKGEQDKEASRASSRLANANVRRG